MCRENSQRQQVQKWLNEGNSITPLQALQMFGEYFDMMHNREDLRTNTGYTH